MLEILFILFMAFISRAAGGGFYAEKLNKKGAVDDATGKDKGGVMPFNLSMLPEIIFGLAFGAALFVVTESIIAALAVSVWCFAWMETGHGTVLHWGKNPAAATGARRQTLTPVVEFISDRLGFERGDVNYCRLFMAVKGFLIGLPVGGVPLAVLWPLGYEVGEMVKKHAVKELAAGAGAGVAILIFLAVGA